MSDWPFNPFYERLADRLGLGVVGKVLIAVFLGLAFFIPYYSLVGSEALHDWSGLLAFLISSAVFFLYLATATLRQLFPLWTSHIEGKRSELFMAPLVRYLSDRHFLMAAFFFGIFNVIMGVTFGMDTGRPPVTALLIFGYFLAGFVCGLPAMGILGVVLTFRRFTETCQLKLDYSAPDRCGGLSFLGTALVKFSVVTLLEGILIASYILLAAWTRADNAWVQLVMWGWVVFPFFCSLVVLILPAIDLNRMLSRYRNELEESWQRKCHEKRLQIEESDMAGENGDTLCREYEYLCQRREEVYNMRTWPFSVGATTSFIGAFLSNVLLAVELAKSLLN